jgi:hypothetical protein
MSRRYPGSRRSIVGDRTSNHHHAVSPVFFHHSTKLHTLTSKMATSIAVEQMLLACWHPAKKESKGGSAWATEFKVRLLAPTASAVKSLAS